MGSHDSSTTPSTEKPWQDRELETFRITPETVEQLQQYLQWSLRLAFPTTYEKLSADNIRVRLSEPREDQKKDGLQKIRIVYEEQNKEVVLLDRVLQEGTNDIIGHELIRWSHKIRASRDRLRQELYPTDLLRRLMPDGDYHAEGIYEITTKEQLDWISRNDVEEEVELEVVDNLKEDTPLHPDDRQELRQALGIGDPKHQYHVYAYCSAESPNSIFRHRRKKKCGLYDVRDTLAHHLFEHLRPEIRFVEKSEQQMIPICRMMIDKEDVSNAQHFSIRELRNVIASIDWKQMPRLDIHVFSSPRKKGSLGIAVLIPRTQTHTFVNTAHGTRSKAGEERRLIEKIDRLAAHASVPIHTSVRAKNVNQLPIIERLLPMQIDPTTGEFTEDSLLQLGSLVNRAKLRTQCIIINTKTMDFQKKAPQTGLDQISCVKCSVHMVPVDNQHVSEQHYTTALKLAEAGAGFCYGSGNSSTGNHISTQLLWQCKQAAESAQQVRAVHPVHKLWIFPHEIEEDTEALKQDMGLVLRSTKELKISRADRSKPEVADAIGEEAKPLLEAYPFVSFDGKQLNAYSYASETEGSHP